MIDVNIDGIAPEHVERIAPKISVDETGRISWVPGFTDYNASLYPRGHQIKSEEFNEAMLKNVFQGNYITDSLNILLNEHLNTAIARTFKNAYNLVPSYIKVFGTEDWGTKQEDDYYYITIPATEHGFLIDENEPAVDRMNIDTEMYLLDSAGHFYEVRQVTVDTANTVQLYTDDNTLVGFVVVRTNDKSYALAETLIDATQILGLAKVATSAKYSDLVDLTNSEGTGPDDRINRNTRNINAIITGPTVVAQAQEAVKANEATYASSLLASGKIQNINVSDIFETGSSYVKNATHAEQADVANYATDASTATKALNADIIPNNTANNAVSLQIGTGTPYTKIINNVASADYATNAGNAQTAQVAMFDENGRRISSIATFKAHAVNIIQRNVLIRVTKNLSNGNVPLFTDSPVQNRITMFVASDSAGGIEHGFISAVYYARITASSARNDMKYVLLNIEDLAFDCYPSAVRLTALSYSYGNSPNTAIYRELYEDPDDGKTYAVYELFDKGYDLVKNETVLVELLAGGN